MNNKREMNLKLITNIQIDGIQIWDDPDFCDAFITSAVWSDTGLELNEEELDELNKHADFIYEKVLSSIY